MQMSFRSLSEWGRDCHCRLCKNFGPCPMLTIPFTLQTCACLMKLLSLLPFHPQKSAPGDCLEQNLWACRKRRGRIHPVCLHSVRYNSISLAPSAPILLCVLCSQCSKKLYQLLRDCIQQNCVSENNCMRLPKKERKRPLLLPVVSGESGWITPLVKINIYRC